MCLLAEACLASMGLYAQPHKKKINSATCITFQCVAGYSAAKSGFQPVSSGSYSRPNNNIYLGQILNFVFQKGYYRLHCNQGNFGTGTWDCAFDFSNFVRVQQHSDSEIRNGLKY
ncbi:hypothetical protein FKM82_015812 [Ascaphus truei]